MRKTVLAVLLLGCVSVLFAQSNTPLSKKDRKRDVELVTTKGTIRLRLDNATPLHRDNFLQLVKSGFYDGLLFHRVIGSFVIQAGDPDSRNARPGQALGNGGPKYTIPAEFRPQLFHKKGVLAAARLSDKENPQKRSSGSQFYIVQGRRYTDAGLDSVETYRLKRKLPAAHRLAYKTVGSTPHLDQNYTVFGEVVKGLDVVDRIAAEPTSRKPADRPVKDVRIIKAQLVKRKGGGFLGLF